MTERTNWSLHRVGWIETNYVLHEHLEVITVGRGPDANKQCLGMLLCVIFQRFIPSEGNFLVKNFAASKL